MSRDSRTAIIIGASSGIGEALARRLDSDGWRLGLLARRVDRLEAIQHALAPETVVRRIDVTADDAASTLERLLHDLGGVDLIIISAGTGHNNRELEWAPDLDTVRVNVQGFMALAQVAMRHFLTQRRGHLVGITSVAALRGNRVAAAYAASKAFQSVYLDGLRDVARASGFPIVVTEVRPGAVATAMFKPERPLPRLARWLFVASPEKVARQIVRAIHSGARHVYVTRRYALVALIFKVLP